MPGIATEIDEVDGLGYAEIAEAFGISEQMVQRIAMQAIRKLWRATLDRSILDRSRYMPHKVTDVEMRIALDRCHGNRTHTAQMLGITRQTVTNWVRRQKMGG